MSERVCGYQLGRALPGGRGHIAVATLDGKRVIQSLSRLESAQARDVGRDAQGRVVWLSDVVSEAGTESVASPEVSGDRTEVVPLSRLFRPVEYSPPKNVQDVSDYRHQQVVQGDVRVSASATRILSQMTNLSNKWIAPRRKSVALGLGVLATVLIVLLNAPASEQHVSAPLASRLPTASHSAGSADVPVSDPQSAAIDFAMAGQLPALGVVAGISREAYSSVVTSRSGDIVLLDVYVTKPSGQKTFATVLLQKAGTQWRMREVFEPKG